MARIQHVTVTVPEDGLLPEVERFYLLLGGVSQSRPSQLVADTPGRWIGFENTQVHLVLGAPVVEPAHFAMDLGDQYDPVRARLQDDQVPIREARQLWGARRCFVRVPAGNMVELFERPPEIT